MYSYEEAFFSLEKQGRKGSLRSGASLKWMICQVWDKRSTTLCSWLMSHDVICIPRTARYVIRNQVWTTEGAESTSEYILIQQYAIFLLNLWRRNYMYTTNCQVRTARYVVRNQAESAEDAESASEHQRIQQYAILRFNFWRQKDMYTTNCQVCDGN